MCTYAHWPSALHQYSLHPCCMPVVIALFVIVLCLFVAVYLLNCTSEILWGANVVLLRSFCKSGNSWDAHKWCYRIIILIKSYKLLFSTSTDKVANVFATTPDPPMTIYWIGSILSCFHTNMKYAYCKSAFRIGTRQGESPRLWATKMLFVEEIGASKNGSRLHVKRMKGVGWGPGTVTIMFCLQ